MCGADRRPNNNPGPAAVPLGVFAKDPFECSTSAKHFRDPDLDSPSLPSSAPASLPSPRRLELCAAPALFGPAGRLQQPRGALTSKSVFLRGRASRTRSRTRPPPHHCRRCRISESYFSRSPEVGKWAWRRFLLGSLEPCRRVASLIPSSPVSPFYSERSEGSVAPALLVAFVLCRRSCNRAALWLIGCLCCVTGFSMKSCE